MALDQSALLELTEEVRDAVELRSGLTYVWHDHPERGLRALVETDGGRSWCCTPSRTRRSATSTTWAVLIPKDLAMTFDEGQDEVMVPQEFYEDDEPAEEVLAAFAAGEKALTRPPTFGETLYYYVGLGRTGHALATSAAPAVLPRHAATSSNR